MSVYTGAVNGYNQSQAAFAQANATEMAGFGSAAGSLLGFGMMKGHMFGSKGGSVGFEDGGTVDGGAIPSRYFQAGPAMQQGPPANNNQQPQPQQMTPPIPPQNGTPGGIITPQMSPSGGQAVDDVDAKLTVGEFVMPLDVVRFRGKEYFYKEIDKSRQKEAEANARGDIGGEPAMGIPSRNPQFVSRPTTMPSQGMPAAMPSRAVA